MLRVGKGAVVLLGAKGGGRPDQWTIPYAGGSQKQRNSGGGTIHQHTDAHDHLHYAPDGATVVAHHGATGHHKIVGDKVHNAAGIAADGSPTGPYVRHGKGATSNQRYERYQHQGKSDGEVQAHVHDVYGNMDHFFVDGTGTSTRKSHRHNYQGHTHPKGHKMADDGAGTAVGKLYLQHGTAGRSWDHDGTTHQHYSGGVVHHQITSVGQQGGQIRVKQPSTPNFHHVGDDGAGKVHIAHASGNKSWDHDGTTHQHYSGGVVHHQITSVGALGGQIKVKQPSTTNFHALGDDGTGKVHMAHASGNKTYDHDGHTMQHYSDGTVMHKSDGITHLFYDISQSATSHVGRITSRQTIEGTGGSAGHLSLKQSGTSNYHTISEESGVMRLQSINDGLHHDVNVGSGTSSRHTLDSAKHTFPAGHQVGDSGGHLAHTSAGTNHYVITNPGSNTHTHTKDSTTRPSGALHSHPTSDGSILHHLTAGGAGALKRATHSTTPQVVGTGSATISGHNIHIANYVFPGGAPGDPHLKLLMGTVWDSGATSNPGFYSHNPAAIISNTDSAYGNFVYNTSGGGQNTSYAWGTSHLTHDSSVDIYGTKIGSPANLAVGTALWQHIVG
jgi:hypothetical protein